jgi:hypothetical protein
VADPQQGFPQIQSPIADGNGKLQQAWYQLLVSLWNRTGAGTGVDITVLVDEITAISVELAALTVQSLQKPSLGGLALLAEHVEGLEVEGLQRAFAGVPGSVSTPGEILGLAKNVFGATYNLTDGTFGDAANVPQITVNSEGLVTSVVLVPIAVLASGTATASEALTAGNLCNVYSLAGVATIRKADATDDTKPANAFVIANVLISGTATWYGPAQLDTAVSGLTPGTTYFLDTTPGGVTTTPPASAGNLIQKVGFAKSATALMFDPTDGVTV